MAKLLTQKSERERQARSLFMKRTSQLHHAHTQLLNKQLFIVEWKAAKKSKSTTLSLDKYITSNCSTRRLTLPYTLDFLRAQVEKAIGSPCFYCGETKLTLKNFSLDHAIPVTRREEFKELLVPFAGHSEIALAGRTDGTALLLAAFTWANNVVCCIDCNKRKGEMWSADFEILNVVLDDMTAKSAAYVRRQLGLKAHWFGAKKGDD